MHHIQAAFDEGVLNLSHLKYHRESLFHVFNSLLGPGKCEIEFENNTIISSAKIYVLYGSVLISCAQNLLLDKNIVLTMATADPVRDTAWISLCVVTCVGNWSYKTAG